MQKQKFTKTDVAIIILIFSLYGLAIKWCYKPSKKPIKERVIKQEYVDAPVKKTREATPKSLPEAWPEDLGKYYYTIDIPPGYEMEDEEYEVEGESGGNLIVKKHHDWPDISGHFEWYCNEKLTTTQQMYDYVVKHQNAIKKQMQELRYRGLSSDFDEASYYQDHYDDYQDDPEDEIRFPSEIFDANDD